MTLRLTGNTIKDGILDVGLLVFICYIFLKSYCTLDRYPTASRDLVSNSNFQVNSKLKPSRYHIYLQKVKMEEKRQTVCTKPFERSCIRLHGRRITLPAKPCSPFSVEVSQRKRMLTAADYEGLARAHSVTLHRRSAYMIDYVQGLERSASLADDLKVIKAYLGDAKLFRQTNQGLTKPLRLKDCEQGRYSFCRFTASVACLESALSLLNKFTTEVEALKSITYQDDWTKAIARDLQAAKKEERRLVRRGMLQDAKRQVHMKRLFMIAVRRIAPNVDSAITKFLERSGFTDALSQSTQLLKEMGYESVVELYGTLRNI